MQKLRTRSEKLLPSELLEQGWTQGSMFRGGVDGKKVSYCLAGAAGQYRLTRDFQESFLIEARKILIEQRKLIEKRFESAVGWNDDPKRTQEEVVALAKEVEKRLGLRPVATTPKPEPEVEPIPEPTSPAPEPEPEGDETTPLEELRDPQVKEDRVLVGVGD